MARLSDKLSHRLANLKPGDEVEVVLELGGQSPPSSSRLSTPEQWEEKAKAFEGETAPLTQVIERLGGHVSSKIDLNRTLKVRMPAGRISELQNLDQIDAIDLIPRLTRA
jgi:hypothetical protein